MIQSVLNQLIIKLTPLLPRSIVWRIAGKYVAGETAEEALSLKGGRAGTPDCCSLPMFTAEAGT